MIAVTISFQVTILHGIEECETENLQIFSFDFWYIVHTHWMLFHCLHKNCCVKNEQSKQTKVGVHWSSIMEPEVQLCYPHASMRPKRISANIKTLASTISYSTERSMTFNMLYSKYITTKDLNFSKHGVIDLGLW